MNIIEKIFGTHSERELKSVYAIADKIESYASYRCRHCLMRSCVVKHKNIKERLANGETLDDLLPEAFATVREAAKRVLGHGALSGYSSSAVLSCIRDVSQR